MCTQLGGSDHKPAILQLQKQEPRPGKKQKPNWNYKKAKWTDLQKKLDERCKKLDVRGKTSNGKVEMFTRVVLQTVKDTIPRARCLDYTDGWNDHLQQLHGAVCESREAMEQTPTDELVRADSRAKAGFIRVKLQELLSEHYYSDDTASVASRQATARNIVDSVVTRLQPRSNTCNDAAVV